MIAGNERLRIDVRAERAGVGRVVDRGAVPVGAVEAETDADRKAAKKAKKKK